MLVTQEMLFCDVLSFVMLVPDDNVKRLTVLLNVPIYFAFLMLYFGILWNDFSLVISKFNPLSIVSVSKCGKE